MVGWGNHSGVGRRISWDPKRKEEVLKGQEDEVGYQMGRDGTNHGKTLGLRNTNSSFPTDYTPGSSHSLSRLNFLI